MMSEKDICLLIDVLQPFFGILKFSLFKTDSNYHSRVVKVVRCICFSNLLSTSTFLRLIGKLLSDQCSFPPSQIVNQTKETTLVSCSVC